MAIPHLIPRTDATAEQLASATNVLILGNSLGTDTHLWDLALPTLAAAHTIVRWDLPGHGQAAVAPEDFTLAELASAVIAMADELGISTFDYAGVSVAGGVALELALAYPERVKHSAVVCSSPYFGGTDAWAERIALVESSGTVAVVTTTPARWFAPDFPAKDPGTTEKLLSMVAATQDAGYIQVCNALGSYDARPFLADIKIPVLVISGEVDPAATPEAGAQIAHEVPGARQVIIPGTSHQAVVEKPLDVARTLTDFFAE
ncbi:3-oxoadipate enol-lactonase [Aurantimicrobium minutum]|uniref:alpha/beta fold hydrolase n=1 Tax=Aurantimicrobium minutum TaxID=708131 RepID=UPI0024752083|nr:alpha/beta fold hydrolase [Aurantimicrobium minutum]MDH6532533.1 3-oxoadipate enol-lactonase [Aurantimicrobium minutum]